MKTGSMDPIYHSGSKYEEWFVVANKLKRDSHFLSHPQPHGINRFTFLSDLDDTIEKGDSIYKHASRIGEFEKKAVKLILDDLKMIKATEVTKRSAQKDRKAPFPLLLYGGSSVAKTLFSNILFYHYGKLMDLPLGSEFIYTRNATDPFWSGFNSTMWGLLLDDVGFLKPSAAPNGDPTLLELIQIQNNVTLVPNQAELSDKGRTPVLSKILIATSNTETLNTHAYFSCPLAVNRRLPWVIEIRPKKEYTKYGCMIDGTTLPEVPIGEYPDFWTFKIKYVTPASERIQDQRAKLELRHEFDNIYDMVDWFSKEAILYEQQQDKAMACFDNMLATKICDICHRPLGGCNCPPDEVQSSDATPEIDPNYQLYSRDKYIGSDLNDTGTMYCLKQRIADINEYNEACNSNVRFHLETFFELSQSDNERPLFELWNLLRHYENTMAQDTDFVLKRNVKPLTFYEDLKKTTIQTIQVYLFWWCLYFYLTIPIIAFLVNWFLSVDTVVPYLLNKAAETQCFRQILVLMGNKIERKLGKYKTLIYISSVLGSGLVMYGAITFLMRNFFPKNNAEDDASGEFVPEGAAQSAKTSISTELGVAPKPETEGRKNVWYKEHYQTTTFDVSPLTTSYNCFDFPQVQSMIAPNCVFLRTHRMVNGVSISRPTRAVAIADQVYMCNNHSMPDTETFTIELISMASVDGVNTNIKFLVKQSQVKRMPELDLAFIKISGVPPRKDIRKLFCKPSLNGGFKGIYLARNSNGSIFRKNVENIKRVNAHSCESLGTSIDTWFGSVHEPTSNGDCGAILLVDSAYGPIILGFHYLGDTMSNQVASIMITDEIVNRGYMMCVPTGMAIQSGVPVLSAPSAKRALTELHAKSPLRYCSDGTGAVYGSFAGFRPRHKSDVVPTSIQKSVVDRGYEVKCGPPEMNSWEPWRIALVEMINPVSKFDETILEECADIFAKEIIELLPRDELDTQMVYDNLTAINGAPGVAYVDKINRNTSAGNPWKKSKKFFLSAIPPISGIEDPVLANDEVMDRVDDCINKYMHGIRYMPNFCAHLKDEALKMAKVKAKKTRVFAGAPMDWIIVVRKFFLSSIRLLQNNRFIFEAGPGTVAQSLEWEEIREYITAFGPDRIVGGDFKDFDKKMPPIIIMLAYKILITVFLKSDSVPQDKKEIYERIMNCISKDTAFPLVDFNGDLVEFFGFNPAGHPLTVIVNGLANCLYMRYVYAKLSPEGTCARFKEHVHLMTYGDDNCMGVSEEASWFNHTSIQKTLAEVDIVYTMADKEAESVPYIHINDVSFLKRTWRWDDDVGAYLCPLEHDSIEKMLTVCVRSKTITMEEQATAVIATALREYFFYGRKTFNEKRIMFKEVVKENGLEPYVEESTFPTWSGLKKMFWSASQHVSLDRLVEEPEDLIVQSLDEIQVIDEDLSFGTENIYICILYVIFLLVHIIRVHFLYHKKRLFSHSSVILPVDCGSENH